MSLKTRIDEARQTRELRARIRLHLPRIKHIQQAHDGEHCSYHNCTWLTDWAVR